MPRKSSRDPYAHLSRRELLRLSLVGGAGALLGASRRTWANHNFGSSPATTPFLVAMPVAPVKQPVPILSPAPNTAAFQRYAEFPAQKLYEVRQQEAFHSFHPELPLTKIWGYDGIVPGPTFHARYGEPVIVRFHNDLPANHVGFGIPETVIHLHNGHTGSESDGFPGDFFFSGQYKDNHYPLMLAGGDVAETLNTLWYHDHRMDFTAANTYRGLSGFFLQYDELDSGNENDPNPNALRLPSGEYDVPIVFHDRKFNSSGQLLFDQFATDGLLGDKFIANGKIQPFFKVAQRKYRFRLLNGGPSRFYEFFLSNGQPFTVIANDGNLLAAPVTRDSVRLSVAERQDVIVDFSNIPVGQSIYLENWLEQTDPERPGGVSSRNKTRIIRFDVDRAAPDPSRVPAQLRPQPTIDLSSVVATRTWEFDQRNGSWTINGRIFNVSRVDATIKRGTAEKWILRGGWGWHHPIHIHFEEFRVLKRNGSPPAPHEAGRKDVVELKTNETIEIFMRFRDFLGRYVMHCHNTVHEDHAMMMRWDIVP